MLVVEVGVVVLDFVVVLVILCVVEVVVLLVVVVVVVLTGLPQVSQQPSLLLVS